MYKGLLIQTPTKYHVFLIAVFNLCLSFIFLIHLNSYWVTSRQYTCEGMASQSFGPILEDVGELQISIATLVGSLLALLVCYYTIKVSDLLYCHILAMTIVPISYTCIYNAELISESILIPNKMTQIYCLAVATWILLLYLLNSNCFQYKLRRFY